MLSYSVVVLPVSWGRLVSHSLGELCWEDPTWGSGLPSAQLNTLPVVPSAGVCSSCAFCAFLRYLCDPTYSGTRGTFKEGGSAVGIRAPLCWGGECRPSRCPLPCQRVEDASAGRSVRYCAAAPSTHGLSISAQVGTWWDGHCPASWARDKGAVVV